VITLMGWIVKETPKAVLFVAANKMGSPVWLPKSRIVITGREWDDLLEIPRWLAEANGLYQWEPPGRLQGSARRGL